MKMPQRRSDIPPRKSDNVKRRLDPAPDEGLLDRLRCDARYGGYAKHKARPADFGLPPYTRPRGDATLCDDHAGFGPDQAAMIPRLLQRGIRAGLIGSIKDQGVPRIVWTLGDDGWIFEARLTNLGQTEYHAYPVRPSEAIAEGVYRRFSEWAIAHGSSDDQKAARNCRSIYGFKP